MDGIPEAVGDGARTSVCARPRKNSKSGFGMNDKLRSTTEAESAGYPP
jgi:hypothetical protein